MGEGQCGEFPSEIGTKMQKKKLKKKTTRKERRQWTMHMHSYIRGIEGV
jgi:hypothetical protein